MNANPHDPISSPDSLPTSAPEVERESAAHALARAHESRGTEPGGARRGKVRRHPLLNLASACVAERPSLALGAALVFGMMVGLSVTRR